MDPILNQFNQVHTFTTYSSNINCNIILASEAIFRSLLVNIWVKAAPVLN